MEAERIFSQEARKLKINMVSANGGLKLSESELKRIYLRFAKVYHPDVQKTGDKAKFQKLTEAYERLKADQAGFSLTEEDLFEMYKRR